MYLAEVFFGDIIYVLCKIKFLLRVLDAVHPGKIFLSIFFIRKKELITGNSPPTWMTCSTSKKFSQGEETEHCSSISVELSGIYIISWGRQQEGVEIIFLQGLHLLCLPQNSFFQPFSLHVFILTIISMNYLEHENVFFDMSL